MKDKLDIAFLGGDSAGGIINDMFQDGLSNHPRVNKVNFECVFERFGKMPFEPTPAEEIIDNITKYDIIFVKSDEIGDEREALFDKLGLWDRVVINDCKDDQHVEEKYTPKCLLCLKRSWDTEFLPKDLSRTVPLAYSIMDSYYNCIPLSFYPAHNHKTYSPQGRDMQVTCTLPQCYRGVPRDILAHAVKNYAWGRTSPEHGSHNIQLTLVYTGGWLYSSMGTWYRHPIQMPYPEVNWWYIYMHFLRRSQVIFTAASHSAVCDVRQWESMSSGALVFIDFFDVPMPHPFEEGKHFIKIDMKDLPGTFKKAQDLLSNNEERQAIAQAGFEHGRLYHSTRARMDYVFDEIDKRKKWD